ncbi:MAG: DNA repair protein RadA [Dehalococcoidales bacterium]|nr:DNA repair protein RadA [Dehalococcoidales bacterium]
MAKTERNRTTFVCQQCGKTSLKWMGRCPECQAWNSLIETTLINGPPNKVSVRGSPARKLSSIELKKADRTPLPLGELNRVLGGGLVAGSISLIGGEPGIGKSTLLLQAAEIIAGLRGSAVYVSAEETEQQIKLRAQRLGIGGHNLYLLAETDLEVILAELENMSPGFVVIDSIQTVGLADISGSPGNVTQVRECTIRLMQWAKAKEVPVFIVGHITKSGDIAGPRTLEHIVDIVLYFEGTPFSSYRLLRCVKNRFGSTNEVGVFEMKEKGLEQVENPSQAFITEHEENTGSAIVPVMEGNRPLLIEIQSLASLSYFGMPRRVANGIDFNRLLMIIAVLSKRAGLRLGNQDILVNAAGGLKVEEPAADLPIALSIASSFYDSAVRPGLVVVGEIGLNGELRSVPQLERRITEAARLGFKDCLVPRSGMKSLPPQKDIRITAVSTIKEAIFKGLVPSRRHSKRPAEEKPGTDVDSEPIFEDEELE